MAITDRLHRLEVAPALGSSGSHQLPGFLGFSGPDGFRTFLDRSPAIPQIAVENKKPLATYVDDHKAIILSRADDLKDLPGLDGDCALMIIPRGKCHHGEVDAIALGALQLRWCVHNIESTP